ncbi:MAG: hypothetical protein ACPG80_04560, partial [Rickettsiales bacterium]
MNYVASLTIFIVVIGMVLCIPMYVGLILSFYLVYTQYFEYALPLGSIPFDITSDEYLALWSYWWQHKYQLANADFLLYLFGPPLIALVTSLILLFVLRAPLVDFRPLRKKETIHG